MSVVCPYVKVQSRKPLEERRRKGPPCHRSQHARRRIPHRRRQHRDRLAGLFAGRAACRRRVVVVQRESEVLTFECVDVAIQASFFFFLFFSYFSPIPHNYLCTAERLTDDNDNDNDRPTGRPTKRLKSDASTDESEVGWLVGVCCRDLCAPL